MARARKMTDSDLPLLVVVTGPPAAGKTTIAKTLSLELGLPCTSTDEPVDAASLVTRIRSLAR